MFKKFRSGKPFVSGLLVLVNLGKHYLESPEVSAVSIWPEVGGLERSRFGFPGIKPPVLISSAAKRQSTEAIPMETAKGWPPALKPLRAACAPPDLDANSEPVMVSPDRYPKISLLFSKYLLLNYQNLIFWNPVGI